MICLPDLRAALSFTARNALAFSKVWRGVLLPPFLDPVIFFVALGFGLGAYVSDVNGVPYRDFLAPALCASVTLWSASFEMTYGFFMRMVDRGTHANALTTPLEPEDIVVGELVWAGIRATVYATAFLSVIAVLGYVHSPWALLLPFFVFVGGVAIGAIALCCTAAAPKMDYFNFFFTLVVNPMFLFGGVFFPVSSLPDWAQAVAWLLPMEHLVAIARALAAGGPASTVAWNTLWLVVATVLLTLYPLYRLRRRMVT